MLLLWLAFLCSMITNVIRLFFDDEDLSDGLKIANYALYIVTRSSFWTLLYIYLFKLHDIYSVARYGKGFPNYKDRTRNDFNKDLSERMRFNKICHVFILGCQFVFCSLNLTSFILPYPERTFACTVRK